MPSFHVGRVVTMLVLAAGFAVAGEKTATVYVTTQGTGDRITRKATPAFLPLDQPEEHFPVVIVDKDRQFQTVIGIGGALTDAAAETFFKMPADKQAELLTAMFDRDKGNGYSMGRTNIHSCDFSSASYTYAETPGDSLLKDFTVAHDLKYKIPFIKAAFAKTNNDFSLFASPWSPPAWMKDNNDMLHGGRLLARYRQSWADYFVRFVQEYEKLNIPVWGLTVQNEPMAVQRWESCIFTAQQERDFVKSYLGPTLERAGLSRLKLMIWDHNRGLIYQRAKAVYDDPAASKYVWGAAFHWYVGDHFDNVRQLHEAYPEKNLLFTEGTVENFDPSKLQEWRFGETYGKSIIADLNNGASGWVEWNVLLDETGGPNHTQNFCMAPIICDTKAGTVTYMNSFYYLGHFSKFIRPGARRLACTSNNDNLQSTAFQNVDGKIAVVVMNVSDKGLEFATWIDGRYVNANSPAHSIVTVVF